jgi:hypothetical protein
MAQRRAKLEEIVDLHPLDSRVAPVKTTILIKAATAHRIVMKLGGLEFAGERIQSNVQVLNGNSGRCDGNIVRKEKSRGAQVQPSSVAKAHFYQATSDAVSAVRLVFIAFKSTFRLAAQSIRFRGR